MSLVLVNGIWNLDTLGHVVEATALEEQLGAIIRSTGDHESHAHFWWHLGVGMRASYAHEDPWSGHLHSHAMQAIFDAIGGEMFFLNAQLYRGLSLWYLGASASAERLMEGISAADEVLGIVAALRRFCLSWLRADRGALDEARILATQLSEYGRAHHSPLDEGRGHWVLAEVLRRMGDFEAAERELLPALDMAVPLERPGVLGTLSALRLAQGRAEEALAAAEQAISGCTTMGGCGMFRGAFVRLAHAEALHATGAHETARRVIAEARTHLLAIAGRIPDPDHKQSFLENVPENARTLLLAHAWVGSAP